MNYRWQKEGLLIAPAGQAPWIGTHAALPTYCRRGNVDRIYFSSRDLANRSHIGFVDLDLDDPTTPPRASAAPVLSPGPLGTFDDAGVTPSCVVEHEGRTLLYYTGWSLGVTVPFYLSVGLAVSEDGGTSFTRVSPAPLLDRTSVDPYLTASPWVIREPDRWRMWYVSGTGWDAQDTALARHRYHIRYAASEDGLSWNREGRVCIDYGSPEEYAFGRPCVLALDGGYAMWYSHRGERYRIGFARSRDGIGWSRDDHAAGIDLSPAGWDSEMMAYPVVVRTARGLRMLYNGNGYGRTGIGVATAK